MHLWPSERLRESFKKAYLDKLELNLGRMKREKNQNSNQRNLLVEDDNGGGDSSSNDKGNDNSKNRCGFLRDLLLIVSCCYCCFCCGACIEEEN